MYEVDRKDRVIEVTTVPRPDEGAPLPFVVSDEGNLILAYIVSESNPNWDGTFVTIVTPESDGLITVVTSKGAYAHLFGPPNDETFAGHPLASRGLEPYAVWEVQHSSWTRRLEKMNSVHPLHSQQRFAHLKHYISAFHDSTFECIAEGFPFRTGRSSLRRIREAIFTEMKG